MEMVKDETLKEMEILKAKIEDKDIKTFADNFLAALEVT